MALERDVQHSLFPDIQPDKPVSRILGSVFVGTNAELIAAVAPFYLDGRVVCDTTFGEGGWWEKYTPRLFVAHDKFKGDGVDVTALPEVAETYGAMCFDPPYIPQGGYDTSTAQPFADRFGLTPSNAGQIFTLMRAGIAECARVLQVGGYLLVKCNDFVNSRRFQLGHKVALDAAEQVGLRCHDLIVHFTGSGPGGHNIFTPIRARRQHSYLLVFAKDRASDPSWEQVEAEQREGQAEWEQYWLGLTDEEREHEREMMAAHVAESQRRREAEGDV